MELRLSIHTVTTHRVYRSNMFDSLGFLIETPWK